MTEKIKNIYNRVLSYIKTHKREVIIALSVLLLFVALTVVICLLVNGNSEPQNKWGSGITEGVPEFSGESCSVDISADNSYAAAYYENVTSEQISEYISQIEETLGVEFNSEKYPRSVVCGDKIIALHYNVTDMRFSVTVAAKAD